MLEAFNQAVIVLKFLAKPQNRMIRKNTDNKLPSSMLDRW